jgi:hypothetical protein
VAVKLFAVNEVVVLAIAVPAVAKLSVDDSHCVTAPVIPLKVKVVLFVPVQTVVLPAMDPPTGPGVTVIETGALFASTQAPLVTTAL